MIGLSYDVMQNSANSTIKGIGAASLKAVNI